ncbi:hypothetical protein Tco_1106665 [Tanacetum coccineum]
MQTAKSGILPGVKVINVYKSILQDEELNHALMAFTVNNEVSMCSKLCLDSYNALQAKYDELQYEFGDQEAALVAHKQAGKKLRIFSLGKKMAREAALTSRKGVHAEVMQLTPAWTNTNRVNVNTGHGNVNSGSVRVNSGTQIKSGASIFNTGKQHVNSGSVRVNFGTQIKSGASRFNSEMQATC